MNARLYNDNPGETQTALGNTYDDLITAAFRPIVDHAVADNVQLRELESLANQIVGCMISEACLRRAVKARQAEREAKAKS